MNRLNFTLAILFALGVVSILAIGMNEDESGVTLPSASLSLVSPSLAPTVELAACPMPFTMNTRTCQGTASDTNYAACMNAATVACNEACVTLMDSGSAQQQTSCDQYCAHVSGCMGALYFIEKQSCHDGAGLLGQSQGVYTCGATGIYETHCSCYQ